MTPFIDVTVVGMDKIKDKLARVPDAAGKAAVEQASKYLLGVLVNKEVPPYRYISYKQAYGKPPPGGFFFKLKHGMIDVPYQRRGRSGGVQSQWTITGSGKNLVIENDDPAAKWVYSEMQARMMSMIGWLRMSQILDKYTRQISDSFDRGVKAAIRKLGL